MTPHQFLVSYLNTPSPTGAEYRGQQIRRDYITPYVDTTFVDTYGTVVGVINPDAPYKVVIEAHADEISRFINYIDDAGMLYVIRNGGSDHQIAPSMRVNLWTAKGGVKGIFGRPAIHTRRDKKEDPELKLTNLVIDVGASTKQEVLDMGIHVGTIATFDADFMELGDKYYTCRALDNRIGGYMIAQVAKMLQENNIKLDIGLYIVNSVQEEIGLKGAEMIVQTIKPDVVIVTDVCHDTSTNSLDKKEHGDTKCGCGPVVSYAPSVHNILRDRTIQIAESNTIPYQRNASTSQTGTDMDAFAYANGGIPSTLISLALRYMHTTVETVSKSDVQHTIDLMYHTVCALKSTDQYKYL